MKNYTVRITAEAERDIEDIFYYISNHDSLEKAVYVLDNLEERIDTLTLNPQRGHFPVELARLGIKSYREIFFKPYRIIYEVLETKVIIHVCIDGRRDLQTLLARRLYR